MAKELELKLKEGDVAPGFTAGTSGGGTLSLDELKGKSVILYFYPKDDTSGCTKEACGFRDRMEDLKKDKVQVIGVSFDSGASHQKFITKYNLNFPLLADTDGKIAAAYGVKMADKNMARRVSFLIGTDGTVKHVTDSPKADVHLSETKDAVEKIKKG